mmetsp:Transcript_36663/g.81585  ORF Transcript_36663/g.81585 Transcript_36663/m.81585 type:complete len:322 (-) Transcript_36663:2060-3025(-)
MTWTTWARTCTTTPSLRCWATGPLATTSRRRPSAGLGSCSPRCTACPPRGCTPPTFRVIPHRACPLMRRPRPSGSGSCLRAACCPTAARRTSGRWATRAHAAPALRSTLTGSVAATPLPWSTQTTPMCWRSGTTCSSSSTASRMDPSSPCPPSTWTPAWAWSVSPPCCRARCPTTPPTCSAPSSMRSSASPAHAPTLTRSARRTLMARTWRTVWWRTTSAPSPSQLLTAQGPAMRAATTCCAAFCAVLCAMAVRHWAPRRASSPSWWTWWSSTLVASFPSWSAPVMSFTTPSARRRPPSAAPWSRALRGSRRLPQLHRVAC